MRIAVIGASGFLGSTVASEFRNGESTVHELRALRISATCRSSHEVMSVVESLADRVRDLGALLRGVDVVVNAAGNPDASSRSLAELSGPNSVLPLLILRAAETAGCARLIHISSAVVQGDAAVLDASDAVHPLTPYGVSKALGEQAIKVPSDCEVVIYRPPSVHHESRRVSRQLSRLASSRLSIVAAPGSDPTPQALVQNVASAIVFMAHHRVIPSVVHHPWEGLTTESLLRCLGSRRPLLLPRPIAKALIRGLKLLGKVHPSVIASARRVEIVLVGQQQAPSWLTAEGWSAPAGAVDWKRLGEHIRTIE